MRPLRSLLVFLVVVFAGGALLAPLLYKTIHAIAPESAWAHNPFHRYVDRALLILALAGIWPLLRSLGATRLGEVGLVSVRGNGKKILKGFLLGFVSLAMIAGIVIAAGGRHFKTDLSAGQWMGSLAGAAGTAVAVAFLEELLFRGAIFGALRKTWYWPFALLLSSMVYAIVHFLQSADIDGPIGWGSGFEVLPRMLAGFGNMHSVIPGFINLTLVGMMLGYAYQRTGNLLFSIGLHGGWIFWVKFYGLATDASAGTTTWLWGTNKLVDGWLALAVLSISTVPLFFLLKGKRDFE